MSIPTICLTDDQSAQAGELRQEIRTLKGEIKALEQLKEGKVEELFALLHEVAMAGNEAYREACEKKENRNFPSPRYGSYYVPTLSDDSCIVVLVKKERKK